MYLIVKLVSCIVVKLLYNDETAETSANTSDHVFPPNSAGNLQNTHKEVFMAEPALGATRTQFFANLVCGWNMTLSFFGPTIFGDEVTIFRDELTIFGDDVTIFGDEVAIFAVISENSYLIIENSYRRCMLRRGML